MSHQSAWYLGAPSVVRRWPELPDTIVIPAMSHQSAVVPESFGSGADPPDTIVIPAVFHQSVCPDVPVVIRGGFNLPDTNHRDSQHVQPECLELLRRKTILC